LAAANALGAGTTLDYAKYLKSSNNAIAMTPAVINSDLQVPRVE
jgi:hypothetical protein